MVWNDQSGRQTPAPECERFHDDIAVMAIGALERDEQRRLLIHLDGLPAVWDSPAGVHRGGGGAGVAPIGRNEPSGLSPRIMDSIRSSEGAREGAEATAGPTSIRQYLG